MADPIAFTVFGKPVYWYGILIAAAVVVGIILSWRETKRRGYNPDSIIDFALIAIPISIICARIYYVVFSWDYYANDFWSVFKIWEGGLAIYGAIIGGVLAALIYGKFGKIRFWDVCDIVVPALALGQAVGRWGNFFNQEAYGELITNPAFQKFPIGVYIESEGAWHMATFFYEFVWDLLLFILLMAVRKKKFKSGSLTLMYFMFYGIGRFFIEGLRTDSLYWGDFRVSQVLSLVLVFVCGAVLVVRFVKKRKLGAAAGDAADGGETGGIVSDLEGTGGEEAPAAGKAAEAAETEPAEDGPAPNEPADGSIEAEPAGGDGAETAEEQSEAGTSAADEPQPKD
ncbi:prolipoprotein diacylglyceryl transferase [Gehongia tenuis]|uniref:Phosphatidylglycerol--prolipoprotein diacylglyceryl transferase n=1 Tax=Gehongia tenuis TaxID=2763655 RepID=A0A926HNT2_9FIRM|nr:prolipoprotein diacylglyceryl transferase [Gehongia tenuis]MBC8530944.1 prolipoprotein diacylglyceryl transferase [Gehongia tenuis]